MKNSKYFVLFLAIAALIALSALFVMKYNKKTETPQNENFFAYETTNNYDEFSDGLVMEPDSITTYEIEEFDVGPTEKIVYYVDINKDNVPDRITKTYIETFNAHSYHEYKIELKTGDTYKNITPKYFRTVSGADCDLRLIQFKFNPEFRITIISRDLGDSYSDPTIAKKQIFKLSNNDIALSEEKTLRSVCDVKELF